MPLRVGSPELGFAVLQCDAIEVMLQTRASVRGCDIAVPRRRTFYGADEIGVRAPGGHVLLFAQRG